jgi:hypothetical protein
MKGLCVCCSRDTPKENKLNSTGFQHPKFYLHSRQYTRTRTAYKRNHGHSKTISDSLKKYGVSQEP